MSKNHLILIASSVLFFLVLYFGFDIVPPDREQIDQKRSMVMESTDVKTLLAEARKELSEAQLSRIAILEIDLENAAADSTRSEVLKSLSGAWYSYGRPAIAGFYAQEVAELENTATAWSIAGATYNYGLSPQLSEKVRKFCTNRAINAFENAVSLEPDNLDHRINLSLIHVASPPKDNPMRGILMLRRLNEEHPENVKVLNNLGRLAIQTGQYEKALERLEKANSLETNNRTTVCLLANAYQGAGQMDKASRFQEQCARLQ